MSRDTIRLPHDAYRLLQTLRAAGHSAYVVGGCVRDSLLGRLPGDWDICTSARPDEMKALFCSQRLILTGEKHGTVAVILHGKPYEMTTYRLDGSYRDHRHPDNVQFVDDLASDLARRDFTINAMAYAPGEGVIDLYGGRSDLAARVVRCVGTPADRFAEDALRILRALRFSAKLGFALDPATAAAALAARDTLRTVSAERLYTELDGLLLAPGAGQTLAQYGEILSGAVPEILPCIGCTQPGKWHCYDVWQHSAAAVGALDLRGQDTRGVRVLCWATFLQAALPQRRAGRGCAFQRPQPARCAAGAGHPAPPEGPRLPCGRRGGADRRARRTAARRRCGHFKAAEPQRGDLSAPSLCAEIRRP